MFPSGGKADMGLCTAYVRFDPKRIFVRPFPSRSLRMSQRKWTQPALRAKQGLAFRLLGPDVHPLCGGAANCGLARLAQIGKVFFDAQEQATGTKFDAGTLLPNVCPTDVKHSGDLHEPSLTRLTEFLEMCIATFGKSISSRFSGVTKFAQILGAR